MEDDDDGGLPRLWRGIVFAVFESIYARRVDRRGSYEYYHQGRFWTRQDRHGRHGGV